ncbi:SET domain [Macleaya cordata]|uniref:SET domain n=1 Tax=Macleaya cordata TaxID=56857 RepID=A0A200QP28_MACCD|nr:SET domain [Macleaya cordata]
MASLFSISSSPFFFSSVKPHFSQRKRPTLHLTVPFTVKSLLSPATDTPSPAVQTFWQWLCDKGVVSANSPVVKPGIVPEGLGLIAQRDMSRNEVVLEVPKKFWINPDTVASSEIGKLCGGLKPWVSVALFLLREKSNKDSLWRSYLEILPEQTNSTIYWSEEELSELQGTQLLNTTLGVKEYVQSEFLKIKEEIILPNKHLFPSITMDDFIWAFGILRSRAFSRLRGQNLVLIPLADLINHNSSITTEDNAWEIKGGGLFSRDVLFSLRTPVSVKSGEQVYIQYDLGKSNAELALDYGFVESRSDRNAYTLTLEISESDPFFGDKLDIAESNGLVGETAYFDIVLGHSLPPALLPYLRLVALGGTDAFLLESIFRNSVWGHLELPVSRANEELICRVVRNACRTALSGYKTTIEEDEKLLEGGNLDPRLEIAVGVRAGEKRVLEQIDEIFKNRELELDELEYYQERRLKDLGLVGEQGDIIFWEPK